MSTESDDSMISIEPREKQQSSNLTMTATMAGWVMQNPVVFSILCVCCSGCTVVGFAAMFKVVDRETVSITQIISGILTLPMLFTIYHAPFNLIKILDNTINRLTENNEKMTQNNQVYSENNQLLVNEIHDLKSTKDQLNVEVSRLKLVETGLQQGLSTMSTILIAGSDKQKELQQALEHVYNDMVSSSDELSSSSSEFMKSLLKMEDLTEELRQTASDNQDLTEQLNTVLDELTNLLNDQKQVIFNDKLHDLTTKLDSTSDGPNGLRQRLAERTVTVADEEQLLQFLNELDDLLKLHADIEKYHSDTKSRMRSRGLTNSPETTTVVSLYI